MLLIGLKRKKLHNPPENTDICFSIINTILVVSVCPDFIDFLH
jgi:hypothetical protein